MAIGRAGAELPDLAIGVAQPERRLAGVDHEVEDALDDLRDADTPAPSPTDERGRSAQRFAVDVVVRRGTTTRRTTATGRDIYAVSAPIVVEGSQRHWPDAPAVGEFLGTASGPATPASSSDAAPAASAPRC